MHFIIKSICLFQKNTIQQLKIRKDLFDDKKTPKRVFSFWFFVFTLGQIGIITSILWSILSGDSIVEAISRQGKSGNFLTFEISLILSSLIYYFEEYGEGTTKDLFALRVTLLISAMIIAFLAMINYIYINNQIQQEIWSCEFIIYNIILYIIGTVLSYWMYITFSVVEESVSEAAKDKIEEAKIAAQSMQSTKTTKIGGKEISL